MTQDEHDELIVSIGHLDRMFNNATIRLDKLKTMVNQLDPAASATQSEDITSEEEKQPKKDIKLVITDPAIQELVDQHRALQDDTLKKRAEESMAEQDSKPRVAPYEVQITNIKKIGSEWSITVLDKKYDETTVIKLPKSYRNDSAIAVANALKEGRQLGIEMSKEELKEAQWLPNNTIKLEDVVAEVGTDEAAAMGAAIQNIMNEAAGKEVQVVFADPEETEEL